MRLFPHTLGFQERYFKTLQALPSWEEAMLIVEAGNHKASAPIMHQALEDERAKTLAAVRLFFELKPPVRRLIKEAARLPNLQAVYFNGPRNWDHFEFLSAYPGLKRFHAEAVHSFHGQKPVRHIGLEYLGLEPDRWGIKTVRSVSDCVFPNLKFLRLDIRTVGTRDAPEAVEIISSFFSRTTFPNLEHLGLIGCRFGNRLLKSLAETLD
ncbi:MAG: hypothetical protein AAF585_29410 [Verrucomicrobiota bacterium]